MRYIVKPGCSFFIDFEKKVEGDVVGPFKVAELKRVNHLVEPYDDTDAPAPVEIPLETLQEAAETPSPAVEGDDTPEEAPAPKRRRRAVKTDG